MKKKKYTLRQLEGLPISALADAEVSHPNPTAARALQAHFRRLAEISARYESTERLQASAEYRESLRRLEADLPSVRPN